MNPVTKSNLDNATQQDQLEHAAFQRGDYEAVPFGPLTRAETRVDEAMRNFAKNSIDRGHKFGGMRPEDHQEIQMLISARKNGASDKEISALCQDLSDARKNKGN